ncbi:hypothetical protein [Roseiconus lacunae]|uniref:Uncharacterized protein n=1 Tax=Roseiconus lacunae TaxID=2605694 RepID=A0ABT7PH50_9BACT|nr:hypothetical protein [Roseiconus lacunae]MDM4015830.1 hypothetical protein [Roseiconus lacunae]
MLEYLTVRLQGFGQQLLRSKGGDEAQKSLNGFLGYLSAEIREGELKF